MPAAELEALLAAHAFLRVERPPELWAVSSELERFVRLLGELIAAGLSRNGGNLEALTLNVANLTVEPEAAGSLPGGDFVALTIRSAGDWSPESTWAGEGAFVSSDLATAAAGAGAVYGYTRVLGDGEGAVTVLVPRMGDMPTPG